MLYLPNSDNLISKNSYRFKSNFNLLLKNIYYYHKNIYQSCRIYQSQVTGNDRVRDTRDR